MYNLSTATTIDINTEVLAMVTHLQTHWNNIPEPEALIHAVQKRAAHDARFWFDSYRAQKACMERAKARKTLLQEVLPTPEKDTGPDYDVLGRFLWELSLSADRVKEAGRDIDSHWDFSDRAQAAYREALRQYPRVIDAKPKGWTKLAKDYQDFGGMEEYAEQHQLAEEQAFAGADTASAGASGFPGRVSLPHVMYSSKCQGRSAPCELISAVYAHLLFVQEHLNTVSLLEALSKFELDETQPKVVFDITLPLVRNPLLNCMAQLTLAEQDKSDAAAKEQQYHGALAHKAEFEALTPEEQDIIRTRNRDKMMEQVRAMVSEAGVVSAVAVHDERMNVCKAFLQSEVSPAN